MLQVCQRQSEESLDARSQNAISSREGCVDFLNVFRKLKELNYRGTFLIEMWTEKADEPVQEIINARRWIEAKMAEAGWSN